MSANADATIHASAETDARPSGGAAMNASAETDARPSGGAAMNASVEADAGTSDGAAMNASARDAAGGGPSPGVTGGTRGRVNVIVCECGPIIKDAIDLGALCERLRALDTVGSVQCYGEPCSPAGREWLTQFLASHPTSPTVIAGCSIREHGTTFAKVCKSAGVNPYLLVIANIREQCVWVTPDRQAALQKAERIVRAAVARALVQVPLESRALPVGTDVLVLGAGIAGLTAAKLLAKADRNVVLVEQSPAIGGRIPLLAELFPNFECASCMLEPLMDEVLHDPHIELLANSRVAEVVGFLGNFTVQVASQAAVVNPSGCYGCRSCEQACPVQVDNECDFGFSQRKAIFIPYAGALPNVPSIDAAHCRRAQGEDCHVCADACPFGNIDLSTREVQHERRVGAIVVATGSAEEPVALWQGAASIMTAMAFERLQNSSGPTNGVPGPGGKLPARVAFVHCVDALGTGPSKDCAKICCMAIAKQMHTLRAKAPDCEIVDVLWERCAGGKGYRQFYEKVVHECGVRQVVLSPSDTLEGIEPMTAGAVVHYRQGDRGQLLETDLVVYAPPLAGAKELRQTASLLRLSLDEHGFVLEDHPRLRPFGTRTEGVFVAGAAQGPSDAAEASWRGAAAAGAVLSALVPGRELLISPEKATVKDALCGGCHSCVLTCPYGAIRFDSAARVAVVNDVLCRGCGTCAAACPASAIEARNFTDTQIEAEIATYATI